MNDKAPRVERLTMRAVCEHGVSPCARILLVYYCERANSDGASWYSNDTIMEQLGMSRPTFYRVRAELLQAGLLGEVDGGKKYEVAVYPESKSETSESKFETPPSKKLRQEGKNLRLPESKSETSESKFETDESKSETSYRCINSSGIDQELPKELIKKKSPPSGLTLPQAWKQLATQLPMLGTECITPTGLPEEEQTALQRGFAKAEKSGFTTADLLALSDWLLSGAIDSRSSPRQWLCMNLGTALCDAKAWRKAGKPERGKGKAPQRPDTVTSSNVTEARVFNSRESLAAIGIHVSERLIDARPAAQAQGSESDTLDDF